MATPAFVQASTEASGNSLSAIASSVTSVTAGNALIACFAVNAARTITGVSDDRGNTGWTLVVALSAAASKRVEIWRCVNVVAGTTVVTGAISGTGTPAWNVGVIEASNISITSPNDVSSSLDTPTETTTVKYCAPAGSIDTTTDIFAVCVVRFNTSTSTLAAPSGWVKLYPSGTSGSFYVGYDASATALTDDRGGCTHASVSRDAAGVIASFKADAAGSFYPPRPVVISQAVNRAATY